MQELEQIHQTEGLNDLAQSIFQANKAKGFWDKDRNVGEMLMLVTSELGEAMEAHRKELYTNMSKFAAGAEFRLPGETEEEAFKHAFRSQVKDTFEDEIADAVIRLLDLCGGLNIDIAKHVEMKLRYNATRERLHGKQY